MEESFTADSDMARLKANLVDGAIDARGLS